MKGLFFLLSVVFASAEGRYWGRSKKGSKYRMKKYRRWPTTRPTPRPTARPTPRPTLDLSEICDCESDDFINDSFERAYARKRSYYQQKKRKYRKGGPRRLPGWSKPKKKRRPNKLEKKCMEFCSTSTTTPPETTTQGITSTTTPMTTDITTTNGMTTGISTTDPMVTDRSTTAAGTTGISTTDRSTTAVATTEVTTIAATTEVMTTTRVTVCPGPGSGQICTDNFFICIFPEFCFPVPTNPGVSVCCFDEPQPAKGIKLRKSMEDSVGYYYEKDIGVFAVIIGVLGLIGVFGVIFCCYCMIKKKKNGVDSDGVIEPEYVTKEKETVDSVEIE